MARIRSIHPDACDSEKLAELSDAAERLFWRLQTHCDDEGRCDDDPRIIRARCATLLDWSTSDVDTLLDELHDQGLIWRYTVAGRAYIEVDQWSRFQSPQRPTRGARPDRMGVFSKPVRRGKAATPDVVGRLEHVDETRRGQVRDASDRGAGRVAAGGEGIGTGLEPPNGGGGSRGEGVAYPQDDLVPGADPDFVRLQSRIADVSSRLATTGEPS